ncbi:MBOAT family protein [Piscinibacter sp. HJYY11]|uniref:MBOAT family O-acyltransferase n=1 Tax=Piscinibacter sp. HJYY11 TaxID=2801333 RepID=UPI00191F650E|nr:MBOAT family protein [Piscinibacter sp. HJYY11]MBL0730292.1 MBOAT family protein [Piscinibacter sp. HJYY11]
MNFASLQFAYFLIFGFALYALLSKRLELQNALLLVGSYYFYACWDVRFLLLIWLITGASYLTGRLIAQQQDPAQRKRSIAVYTVFALCVLGYFKYFNFFIDSAQTLLLGLGFEVRRVYLDIVLPPAISFYVFESLSYVIEIHHRHMPGTTKFRHYALFIAYFPKLVAGPIERPAVLIPQIEQPRFITEENITRGSFLILLGLFKKIVIADGMAPTVDSVFNSAQTPNAWAIALGTYAFALQIYCDFSGYTDIARGVSKLLGIELSQNFRFPYFSSNPSEFWRRWHMSLSSWLRDYLYIPLGGNRVGAVRTKVNLMLTMLLGGLWHGAAWNFILWGGYQGLLLVVNSFIKPPVFKGTAALVSRVVATVVFFQFVCYGWLLFRANSFEQIRNFTVELLTLSQPLAATVARPPLAALLGVAVLALYDLAAYRSGRATFYRDWPAPLRAGLYAVLVFLTLMGLASARSAFIYFQF